jgi:quinol monooxygenase YgiN
MLVVHVHVRVKPDCIEPFKTATRRNARLSVLELGCLGFNILQQSDNPAQFVLVETYRNADAAAAHKNERHYILWRDTVAPMMAEPRQGLKFDKIDPDEGIW